MHTMTQPDLRRSKASAAPPLCRREAPISACFPAPSNAGAAIATPSTPAEFAGVGGSFMLERPYKCIGVGGEADVGRSGA